MKAAKVTLHLGRKGSGKSYMAKREAERAGKLVAVWDPRREWAGPGACDPPRMRRLVVRTMAAFRERQLKTRGPLAPCVVFQLEPTDRELALWCRWILRAGQHLVVVDEAQLVAPPHYCPPPFRELVTTCRHVSVDLLLCCQRPSTIHPDVRAQADIVRAWKMVEPRDLEWMREFCGSDFAKRLPKLGPQRFLDFQP